MFKYVSDVSDLSHNIIKNYCRDFNVAVDATLGNGYDTDFLKEIFSKVYAFDIQKCATEKYKEKNICNKNVVIINDSHHKFNEYIKEKVNCFIYNLGYLPGGDKKITTIAETTVKSIKYSLELLSSGGLITISIYHGHEQGQKEKNEIFELLNNLPKNKYGVLLHTFYNRSADAPILAVIEKK
ncbi:16S rRNA m(4) methyltransferase [Clostridium tepidiprofundi DSM 19306]|uniref:16S rRNA m(4) methyltransferase n=1 Tax=Clostridium tepidiprofundi DSM 19306 TaxID=1121338 RepID=A0A151B7H4_9CLOT|nr:class I SAM-dependent methyltransferase [Clostridium tepidiprofundi]KYH35740.1 16S rRNA m(4) methyltransferase [Clostridium tepidiprofundi DSM 19306]